MAMTALENYDQNDDGHVNTDEAIDALVKILGLDDKELMKVLDKYLRPKIDRW